MDSMIIPDLEILPEQLWVSNLYHDWADKTETHLARLYGAHRAFAVSTGMSCLDIILRMVKPGETVLAGDDLYGGTNRLLTYLSSHVGVDVRHVDTTRVEELEPHLGPGNK